MSFSVIDLFEISCRSRCYPLKMFKTTIARIAETEMYPVYLIGKSYGAPTRVSRRKFRQWKRLLVQFEQMQLELGVLYEPHAVRELNAEMEELDFFIEEDDA